MNKVEIESDPKVISASERLLAMELSSFNDYLDANIKCRIRQLLENADDGCTPREALLGKSGDLTPVFLSFNEVRNIRYRSGLEYVDKKNLIVATIPLISSSLERTRLEPILTDLRVQLCAKTDKFKSTHMVFENKTLSLSDETRQPRS